MAYIEVVENGNKTKFEISNEVAKKLPYLVNKKYGGNFTAFVKSSYMMREAVYAMMCLTGGMSQYGEGLVDGHDSDFDEAKRSIEDASERIKDISDRITGRTCDIPLENLFLETPLELED